MKIQLEFDLSDDDLASIAHFCEKPEEWATEQLQHKVSEIMGRIGSFRQTFLEAKARLGDQYKNRAQRNEQEKIDMQLGAAKAAESAKAEQEAFEQRVAKAVQQELARKAATKQKPPQPPKA